MKTGNGIPEHIDPQVIHDRCEFAKLRSSFKSLLRIGTNVHRVCAADKGEYAVTGTIQQQEILPRVGLQGISEQVIRVSILQIVA
jgi:hypothetical protein